MSDHTLAERAMGRLLHRIHKVAVSGLDDSHIDHQRDERESLDRARAALREIAAWTDPDPQRTEGMTE